MTKLCDTCEYLRYCARSGIEEVGCDRYKKDMTTNEEWLHTLNTEEKAFALETIIRSVLVQRSPMCHDVCNREFWERWLKEKHTS